MKMQTLFLALFLLLISPWVSAQSITLVTLGDSLTAGDGDEEGENPGGFPPRLLEQLQDTYPGSTLNNFAVSGFTSDDLINIELSPAIQSLRSTPTDNLKIALVWIGSNDLFGLYNNVCDEYFPNNYPRCEQEDRDNFHKNLAKILKDLQASGARVFIALLDDQSRRPFMIDTSQRNDFYSQITEEEVKRMSSQVDRYNETILDLSTRYKATSVNFNKANIFTDKNLLSSDGNHPNSKGYELITDQWYQAIMAALSQKE